MTSLRRWRGVGVVVVILAGCSALGPRQADVTDFVIDPSIGARSAGPVAEIGRGMVGGTEWAVVAFIAEGSGNLCSVNVVSGSASGSACGPVDPLDVIGPITTAPFVGDDGILLYAVMDAQARKLRVETSVGNMEADIVSLTAIGVDRVAAAIHLPPGHDPAAVVALDGGGRELERFALARPR